MFKVKFVLSSLRKVALWKWPAVIFHLLAAKYYLLRLKLEYYVPPVTNLFRPVPESSVQEIYVSQYVPWDVDRILSVLHTLGWKSPTGDALPMRFDCRIDDSFMNYTFQKATGLSTHTIIANNLIYAGARTKQQLQESVDEYERIAAPRTREQSLEILSQAHDEEENLVRTR
jgi:hypothetical protein